MKRALLERWVYDVLARVERHQPTEDSQVELKRQWIAEPQRAARRIAAHANAAQGEPILWLIGVDEECGVVGADAAEMSNWLAGIQKHFDAISPSLISNLVIDTATGPVVALLFSTDDAPYVVKTGTSGGMTHEVPWREGNGTRSALRRDLRRLLVRRTLLPDVEIVSGDCSLTPTHVGPGEHDYGACFRFRIRMYVAPRSEERITIPRHRCSSVLTLGAQEVPLLPYSLQLLAPSEPRTDAEKMIAPFRYAGPEDAFLPSSVSVKATVSEVIVSGPGFLLVHGAVLTREHPEDCDDSLLIRLRLMPAGADLPVIVTATMERTRHPDFNEIWWHCD